MRKKRFLSLAAAFITFTMSAIPVTAAETSDKPFSIPINSTSSTPVESTTNPVRIKTDASSTYINYNGSGPSKFVAIIYGCDSRGHSEMDCTSNYTVYVGNGTYQNITRPPAIVTRGTRGFVRQDVAEKKFTHAKLKGKYYSGLGTAKGEWSPDSVYEAIGDYNN